MIVKSLFHNLNVFLLSKKATWKLPQYFFLTYIFIIIIRFVFLLCGGYFFNGYYLFSLLLICPVLWLYSLILLFFNSIIETIVRVFITPLVALLYVFAIVIISFFTMSPLHGFPFESIHCHSRNKCYIITSGPQPMDAGLWLLHANYSKWNPLWKYEQNDICYISEELAGTAFMELDSSEDMITVKAGEKVLCKYSILNNEILESNLRE